MKNLFCILITTYIKTRRLSTLRKKMAERGDRTVASSGDSGLDEKISEWLSLDQVNMIYEGGFPGHLFRISHSHEYFLDTCCVLLHFSRYSALAIAYLLIIINITKEAKSCCLSKV